MNGKRYLETFFEEKEIPFKVFVVRNKRTMTEHIISNEQVIEAVMDMPYDIQDQIAEKLMAIDFRNGSVNHFLEYVATGLVQDFEENKK